MNLMQALFARAENLIAAVRNKAGSLADLQDDAKRLRTRALLIAQRNNDEANDIENEIARLEAEADRLDVEADEANLIAVAMRRLVGA